MVAAAVEQYIRYDADGSERVFVLDGSCESKLIEAVLFSECVGFSIIDFALPYRSCQLTNTRKQSFYLSVHLD